MTALARAIVFALAIAGCQSAPASTAAVAPTSTATTAARAATVYGLAGLITPHTGSARAQDYEALYRSLVSTGGALGVYTNWADTIDAEGRVPAAVAAAFAAAKQYGFGPVVVALGVAREADGRIVSTVEWGSPERERFVAAAAAVARDHHPEFLALGVEVNRLATADPAAFDGFVKGYGEAYDAIKKVSPQTRVFTIFQLELMRGHARFVTLPDDSPQWPLLARFAGRLDLVGYTSYPFLQFARPQDVPDDYYVDAASRADAAIAFTEVGWPSSRPVSIPNGYVASAADQAAFVDRFFALTASVRPGAALWSFPYERGVASDLFDSVALRGSDGSEKPALAAWQRGVGRR